MKLTKILFVLTTVCLLSPAFAAPQGATLAGLRTELMQLKGRAPSAVVRRVLSYREGEETLLLSASRRGDVALIEKLAQTLPDSRVFQQKDSFKRNAFHWAADYNTALALMKTYSRLRLHEGVPQEDVFDSRAFRTALMNAGDLRGETPLMYQVKARRYEVAFLYLTKNADLCRKAVSGETAVHLLVRQCTGHSPEALTLLARFLHGEPYVVFLRDGAGRTPLELAQKLRARLAYEKIKEVQQQESESRVRNLRILLRNFLNS